MIISVSRRCDIPRFQFDWFMERVNEGFVDVTNPYNAAQKKRVPLVPMKEGLKNDEGADAFVFWTRNPEHILKNADELIDRGFPFYVMASVTDYPDTLEPNQVPAAEVINSMKELAAKIGSDKVIWRYDPIIFSNITCENFHRENFERLAGNFGGSVKRVIISLYDEYRGAKKRLDAMEKSLGLKLLDTGGSLHSLLADIAKSAVNAGMEIQSCAEKENFSSLGIKPGACINGTLIENICGKKTERDKNQRPDCLCCKSVDIGAYGTCQARCVYCYAW